MISCSKQKIGFPKFEVQGGGVGSGWRACARARVRVRAGPCARGLLDACLRAAVAFVYVKPACVQINKTLTKFLSSDLQMVSAESAEKLSKSCLIFENEIGFLRNIRETKSDIKYKTGF